MLRLISCSMIVLAVLAAAPAFTQDPLDWSERVQVHGFGTWAYGKTDGNHYLYGNEEGDYSHALFHLNLNARVTNHLTISSQVGWVEGEEDSEVDFDYAFAEWKFSDLARLRLGKVKHPLGLFGEIMNVGTLRPFVNLPQSVYGPQGYAGKGYNGIGLTGAYHTASDWGVLYDVYGGQLKAAESFPFLLIYTFTGNPQYLREGSVVSDKKMDDVLGTRLTIATPGDLRFGLSAFTGEVEIGLPGVVPNQGREDYFGAHFQYRSNRLWVHSEIFRVSTLNKTDIDGGYAEVAYKLTARWQIAARYDVTEITATGPDFRFFSEWLQHHDLAFGVNLWLDQRLVLKLSYHRVDGFRFVGPTFDDPLRALLYDEFDTETNLIQFGAQFSF